MGDSSKNHYHSNNAIKEEIVHYRCHIITDLNNYEIVKKP